MNMSSNSIEQFDIGGFPNEYSPSMDFGSVAGENIIATQTHVHGAEDWWESGEINSFWSELGFSQDNKTEEELLLSEYQREHQVQLLSNFGSLDDLYVDIVSPPFQSCDEEISELLSIPSQNSEVLEPEQEKSIIYSSPSFKVLNSYGSGFSRLNAEKIKVPNYKITCTDVSSRKLSTNSIIKLAAEKFIQSCSQTIDELSMLSHPYASSVLGLSDGEVKDVELVHCLLASTEKVSQQQFDRASKLLDQHYDSFSNRENPIQRIVHCFSEALREKIDRETVGVTSKGLGKKQKSDVVEIIKSPDTTVISFYQNVPFIQICQFSGIQAIIDNVGGAKKVHIIDLEMRGGSQCTILMQALAARDECPLERLKITAIGTGSKLKIEQTGKQLMSFARSLNLPFSFNIVMVADMLNLNEGLFELDAEEAVAVYSPYVLNTMIQRPDRMECLMRVMRNINPCVMVVIEIEANHNSPVFVTRFIEALFFYGALFDSLEVCMFHDEQNRMMLQSAYFGQVIRNIVATESEERTIQHVNINVWKAFFARFGMVEVDLSLSSLYQADLLLRNVACGSSCTLNIDGKSLMIGWKGTPLYSLSTHGYEINLLISSEATAILLSSEIRDGSIELSSFKQWLGGFVLEVMSKMFAIQQFECGVLEKYNSSEDFGSVSRDEEISKLESSQSQNLEDLETKRENSIVLPSQSVKILRLLNGEKMKVPNYGTAYTNVIGCKLSTDAILRYKPSDEEVKDVGLVQNLLASAEKVGQQQFDHASKRLNRKQSLNHKEAVMSPDTSLISFYQKVPFIQVSQVSGVQTIIENVGEAKKVHIIDLEIRGGIQCTILMQALVAQSDFPLEHLKITAIGTISKPKIKETGKRLMSFAQSMNLPFSFNVVMVADMLDLNEDLFNLDAEEVVAVYSPYVLNGMIQKPDRLECSMKVMRNINPRVMVVIEVEANINSPHSLFTVSWKLFYSMEHFSILWEMIWYGEDRSEHVIPVSSKFVA
ncbi:unnamed protein product [Ilex paraguariensis]|uniref:DELLA protein n=1 Tax=Ilex paraguariensis TaxID=185542 RepID=A0ABC8RA24_9AQUA